MKAILATSILCFFATVCLANPPQNEQARGTSNVTEILTYNNISQKPRSSNAPKVYAHTQESLTNSLNQGNNNANPSINAQPARTFSPNPLVNYYKEFR